VVVAEIDLEKGRRVAESIVRRGGEATFIPVDVLSTESVRAMVGQALSAYGRIDVLYHNAVDARFVNQQDRRLRSCPKKLGIE